MQFLRFQLLPVLLLLAALSGLQAQQSSDSTEQVVPATTPVEPVQPKADSKPTSKAGQSTPTYYRHHKKLPATYSGFGIELVTSELPLKRNYPLFQQFGNVYYEKLDKGGYAYVLLVKFSSKKALKNYIEQVVKPKAPEAKALVYRHGVRKKK